MKKLYLTTALILAVTVMGACSDSPNLEVNKAAAPTSENADIPAPSPSAGAQYVSSAANLKNQPAVKAAFDDIVSHRQDNVAVLIELTEIPAPPFGEDKRGERFAQLLRDAGLTDITRDEVGNIIGKRAGRTGKKTVAIAAHVDTVFPIETDVTVKKDGDVYTAPGIGDNTRGMVLLLSLLKAMENNDIETDADILFIGNVGEEGLGDLRGVKHLYRDRGPKLDALIAVDGGRIDRLIYGGVGSIRYRVTYEGPGGHSWGAFGMANPHHALGRAMNLFAQAAPAVSASGPKTSFNVGRIGGGTSVNSIPFESWMEVDMRSGDVDKLEDMHQVFLKSVNDGLAAENAARKHGPELTVDTKKVGHRPAGTAPLDQPLIQNAMAAMETMGIQPNLRISSTDANIPISMGKPAITISRGGITRKAHSLGETWEDKDSHLAIQLALLILLSEAGYANPE